MNCEKCGELLPEDAEFCPKCAEEEAERELDTVQDEGSVSEETAPVNGISKKMLYGIIGGCVAVVALIVILCVAFSGSKWPIKAGMNMVEVHEALTDEGFVLQEDYDLYDKQKVYDGFVDGIGVVEVQTKFNRAGKIIYIAVWAEKAKAVTNYFLKEFGDYSSRTYKGSYQIGFWDGHAYEYYDDAYFSCDLYDGEVDFLHHIEHEESYWLRNTDGVQSIMMDHIVTFYFTEYLPSKVKTELEKFIQEID